MDDLRIPKQHATAEVTMAGGEVRQVEFFLGGVSLEHSGPERLTDLFNGPSDFIPVQEPGGGQVTFLCRTAIVQVRASPGVAESESAEPAFRHGVEVLLSGGQTLRGSVEYAQDPDHARILDYLSRPSPFFGLRVGEQWVLVNKHHTVQVRADP